MQRFLLSISLLAGLLLSPTITSAQALYPAQRGDRVKYDAMIEMKSSYLSGICILANEGDEIKGSIFNEFGISAIDLTYNPEKDKIKLDNVVSFLNKCYIKRVLRKDLVELLHALQNGESSYRNEKRKIYYQLNPMS